MRFKDQKNAKFDQKCYETLTSRTELFAKAAQVWALLFEKYFAIDNKIIFFLKVAPLETVNDLVEQLNHSPARNFFLAISLSFIAVVLFVGVFCGRITKRNRVMKNR